MNVVIFDWGDTLMCDFKEYSGPMVNWSQVEVIPGVKDALDKLYEKYICCVASNAGDSDMELMGKALERVDIRKYFKHLFTSNELGYAKPSLGFFNEIVGRLNVEVGDCIMVGNDYFKDIIPAKKVGMTTILFSQEVNESDMTYADRKISSMEDLYSEIVKINLVNLLG